MAKRPPSARALEKIQQESQALALVVLLPDSADGMLYAKACEQLKSLMNHQRRIADWFEEPVRALHSAWKTLTGRRGEVLRPIESAIADQKKEIARYQQMREAEAALARPQVEETPDDDATTLTERHLSAALVAPQTVDKQPGIVAVDVWKWRVVDQSRVPEKFKMVDADKVSRLVRAMKGETEIPGIEVFTERQIRNVPVRDPQPPTALDW